MKVLPLEAKKEWRPLNIASVVEATVRRMQPQFSAAGAIVHYESDAQALYVKASNVNIETILHSILGNSIDAFTERHTANPELWVRELLVDDSYQLEITDNAGALTPRWSATFLTLFIPLKCRSHGQVWVCLLYGG